MAIGPGTPLGRARAAVAAAVCALATIGLTACGGSSPAVSTSPGATVSGRAVFAAHCAVCHSISGRPTREQQGGDLRGLRLPRNELVQFTVEMPVIRRPLSNPEVRAVVDYMQSMARRR